MAWLLKGSVDKRTGDQQDFCLKAWRGPAGTQVRWVALRLFSSIGYALSAKSDTCSLWRAQKPKWVQLLDACGVSSSFELGESVHSVHCRNKNVTEMPANTVEQE